MANADRTDQTGKLTFDAEKGAGRSKWIAILLGLVLVGWMGSGFVLPSEPRDTAATDAPALRPVAVAVVASQAADVEQVFSAEGQSEPDRATMIRSEASGQVETVDVRRGDLVAAGQQIARIAATEAQAQLEQARERFAQAQRDYDNAVELQGRGVATQDRVAETRTELAAAQAELTGAGQTLENTVIRAPFPGRLNDLTLDEGEFVTTGAEVGQIVDNDPLTVVIQVPQQAMSRLARGQTAQVRFITGEVLQGTVDFIGVSADAQTRTFRAEILVDNPDSALPAGLSAQVRIPTGQTRGHFISPAILSLGPTGELGVKTVIEGNIVDFVPVTIVRAQTEGIWVTGLPETAHIITVGQGFVTNGEIVDPRIEAVAADGAAQDGATAQPDVPLQTDAPLQPDAQLQPDAPLQTDAPSLTDVPVAGEIGQGTNP